MQKSSKASVAFIFITIALDSTGLGLIIPVLPDVIRRFIFDESLVSFYFGLFASAYSFMQFFSSPLLGSLSDRFGRRPVLLVSLLGAGLDYFLMAFAPYLWVLFVGRVISGLTGASYSVAMAYMADISDDKNRSAHFGMVGAAFGLGFIIGPALGGLLSSFGPQAPFVVAALLNLLNFFFGVFVLPESLSMDMRRDVDLKRLNPLKTLGHFLKPSPILLMIVIFTFFNLAGQIHPAIWTIYTEHKFSWTSFQVGLSLSVVGVLTAISQGGLTRVVIPRLGEYRSVLYGCLIYCVCFFLFSIVTEGWMMYVVVGISCLAGFAPPALQSMISTRVSPKEQGELQGSLVSIMSLTSIITPLIATGLFGVFADKSKSYYFPGAPYMYGTICCIIAFVLSLRIKKNLGLTS